jgi:hypothetical protein
MKINIFDKRTWVVEAVDQGKLLRNKVLGSIGQKIPDLKGLKNKIEKGLKDQKITLDYFIAESLRQNNPVAFSIMEIKYEFSDYKVKSVIDNINTILDAWPDKTYREENWEKMADLLIPLEPYLKTERYSLYTSMGNHDSEILKLVNITVSGNMAWEAYLSAQKQTDNLLNTVKNLNRKVFELELRCDSDRDEREFEYEDE